MNATAQTNELLSVDSSGAQGNGRSSALFLSRDARYAAFSSDATNLVGGDTNGMTDVFLRDRQAGTTIRVSVDSSALEANGASTCLGVSDDGSIVLFTSDATNLVPGDTNGAFDIFVRDVIAGVTERVSVSSSGAEGSGNSSDAEVSGDGRYVAFSSSADNLVAGDSLRGWDVFVHDRQTGTTTLADVDSSGIQANSWSWHPAISGDGRFVAFDSSATNLPGATYGQQDVYLRDLVTGQTTHVSWSYTGTAPHGSSFKPSISDDGSRVEFEGGATDIVPGDNNSWDVFVRDIPTGTNYRANLSSDGVEPTKECSDGRISGDGRFVVFTSIAQEFVSGDPSNTFDVFVHCIANSMTTRASVADDGTGGDHDSYRGSLSRDGSVIGFESIADNLVVPDSNGNSDVIAHSRSLASAASNGYGSGFPGTNGIPSFTLRSLPVLNTDAVFDISNSSGMWSLVFVVAGAAAQDLPMNLGGHLLVVPAAIVVLPLPPGGTTLTGKVAPIESLAGLHGYVQAIEVDPGALHGFSFSSGLDLTLGY